MRLYRKVTIFHLQKIIIIYFLEMAAICLELVDGNTALLCLYKFISSV